MKNSWDYAWKPEADGEIYQLRLYEDMYGEQPNVFVLERADGQLMAGDEARRVHAVLENQAGYEAGASRLWETTPDGKIYEHTFEPYQYDASRIEQDMPFHEYNQDLESGSLKPNIATGYNDVKTEVSPDKAYEITSHDIQSYEQRMEQEWSDLRAPEAGYG